jgi:Asp-tRNA(Asn)/Glu-tRNA(Gln) amidotransferase A subunit family amidase
MSEIWQLSASELADRIARRQLSSIEVVDAHLARIDAVNPSLNAVVRVLADEARASAISADKRLQCLDTMRSTAASIGSRPRRSRRSNDSRA